MNDDAPMTPAPWIGEILAINSDIQQLLSNGHFNGSAELLKLLSDLDWACHPSNAPDPRALIGIKAKQSEKSLRELLEEIDVPMRFWVCPVQEHRERKDVVTVEWDDNGVAHCTHPGCEETSA